jgi:hypothetical protein
MSKLVAVLVLSLGASTSAFAGTSTGGTCPPLIQAFGLCTILGYGGGGNGGGVTAAPEIDPASAMSGVSLLIGGLAVLRGRRKKQQ